MSEQSPSDSSAGISRSSSVPSSSFSVEPTHPEFEALVAVGRHLSSALDPAQLLQRILDTTVSATGASTGTLILIGENSPWMKIVAANGIPLETCADFQLRVGYGVTGWVAKQGQSLLVNDVSQDERYVPLFAAVRAEMAVPLILEGKVIGVLNVDSSDRTNAFSERQLRLLETIAQQTAQVVNVSRLYVELKRRADVFQVLSGIAAEIASTLKLDQVLSRIVSRSAALMGTKLCSLFLTDENREILRLAASHGAGEAYVRRANLEVNWSLVGQVIRTREPLAIKEVRQHPWYKSVEVAEREGLVSMLAVPLIAGEDVIGVLVTYTDHPHYFDSEERDLFMAFGRHAAIAIENARLYELRERAESRVRESETLAALGQMAAGVAHEVRNPLGGIKGAAQLLMRDAGERENLKEYGRVILSEADRLNRMVEELLDYARPYQMRFLRCDLRAGLLRAVEPLAPIFEQKGIRLEKHVCDDPLWVVADEEKLVQVAQNLLLNAQQAVESKGSEGRVVLEAWQEEDVVGFTVIDNGPGISPDQLESVFTPFVTTKPRGTGLGLSIVRRIVEEHRGEVNLSNLSGERGGLAAVVRIPRSKVSSVLAEKEMGDEAERGTP